MYFVKHVGKQGYVAATRTSPLVERDGFLPLREVIWGYLSMLRAVDGPFATQGVSGLERLRSRGRGNGEHTACMISGRGNRC